MLLVTVIWYKNRSPRTEWRWAQRVAKKEVEASIVGSCCLFYASWRRFIVAVVPLTSQSFADEMTNTEDNGKNCIALFFCENLFLEGKSTLARLVSCIKGEASNHVVILQTFEFLIPTVKCCRRRSLFRVILRRFSPLACFSVWVGKYHFQCTSH